MPKKSLKAIENVTLQDKITLFTLLLLSMSSYTSSVNYHSHFLASKEGNSQGRYPNRFIFVRRAPINHSTSNLQISNKSLFEAWRPATFPILANSIPILKEQTTAKDLFISQPHNLQWHSVTYTHCCHQLMHMDPYIYIHMLIQSYTFITHPRNVFNNSCVCSLNNTAQITWWIRNCVYNFFINSKVWIVCFFMKIV